MQDDGVVGKEVTSDVRDATGDSSWFVLATADLHCSFWYQNTLTDCSLVCRVPPSLNV